MNSIIKRIAGHFLIKGDVIDVDSHFNGLVNKTFLVRTQDANGYYDYIIQKINTYVFPNPHRLMENIVHVTRHIASKEEHNQTLHVIMSSEGKTLVEDASGCYRCYHYLENAHNYQQLQDLRQFKEVGRAIGIFQNHLQDFPVKLLYEVIPDFHNTPKRIKALKKAAKVGIKERIKETKNEIQNFLDKKSFLSRVQTALDQKEIPLRVTHNDTKLNNVMFDQLTNRALCLIDLDTVMPGSVLFDFGDALRVGASTKPEDDKEFKHIAFDITRFIAFSAGYLLQANEWLSDKEGDMLSESVYIITMECGMRFLTDYLLGDKYFLTRYPKHNLVRAKNQLSLANDIWQKLTVMQKIVKSLRTRFEEIVITKLGRDKENCNL